KRWHLALGTIVGVCVLISAPVAIGTTATDYPAPGPSNSSPNFIATGSDCNLWFNEVGTNKIDKMTTDGAATEYPTGFGSGYSPAQLTAGPDGNVWFSEGGVNKITPAGAVTHYTAGITPASGVGPITVGP